MTVHAMYMGARVKNLVTVVCYCSNNIDVLSLFTYIPSLDNVI